MLDEVDIRDIDAGEWYHLTDQYADALAAMQRGEPEARDRVLAVYEKLRHLPALNDGERRRA